MTGPRATRAQITVTTTHPDGKEELAHYELQSDEGIFVVWQPGNVPGALANVPGALGREVVPCRSIELRTRSASLEATERYKAHVEQILLTPKNTTPTRGARPSKPVPESKNGCCPHCDHKGLEVCFGLAAGGYGTYNICKRCSGICDFTESVD